MTLHYATKRLIDKKLQRHDVVNIQRFFFSSSHCLITSILSPFSRLLIDPYSTAKFLMISFNASGQTISSRTSAKSELCSCSRESTRRRSMTRSEPCRFSTGNVDFPIDQRSDRPKCIDRRYISRPKVGIRVRVGRRPVHARSDIFGLSDRV